MENSDTNPPTTLEAPVSVPIELESLSNPSNDHAIPSNVSYQSEEDHLSIQTPERTMTAPPPYTPDYTPAYTPTPVSNNARPAARVPKPVATTPLDQLQDFSAQINCPLCHRLAKTDVKAVKLGSSGSSGYAVLF
ncbi:hypothetical protein N7454_004501 [Penicillium verhagenii]|nr:hypothetical protein N7454_004501 [Penicillium verhagenii]